MADFHILTGDGKQVLIGQGVDFWHQPVVGEPLVTIPYTNAWTESAMFVGYDIGNEHAYALLFLPLPGLCAELPSGFGNGSTAHLAPLTNQTNGLWGFLENTVPGLGGSPTSGGFRIIPLNALSMALTWNDAGGPAVMRISEPSNPNEIWIFNEYQGDQIIFNVSSVSFGQKTEYTFSGSGYIPNSKYKVYLSNYAAYAMCVPFPGLEFLETDQNGHIVQQTYGIDSPPSELPPGKVLFVLEQPGGTGGVTGVITKIAGV